uniref:Uncharacterized protein n=1 Tax=Anopheles atroparvus TaxID=41427 RepID=A0A182IK89_ANOAO
MELLPWESAAAATASVVEGAAYTGTAGGFVGTGLLWYITCGSASRSWSGALLGPKRSYFTVVYSTNELAGMAVVPFGPFCMYCLRKRSASCTKSWGVCSSVGPRLITYAPIRGLGLVELTDRPTVVMPESSTVVRLFFFKRCTILLTLRNSSSVYGVLVVSRLVAAPVAFAPPDPLARDLLPEAAAIREPREPPP